MAITFYFFSISTTLSRGLTTLNLYAISHLFEIWSTLWLDIKSSHLKCSFRRSAALNSWKPLSLFSMVGWQYTRQVPYPLVLTPPRFLSNQRWFVWPRAGSTTMNASFVTNLPRMRYSIFQFATPIVAATFTCSTSNRQHYSFSTDSAIILLKN